MISSRSSLDSLPRILPRLLTGLSQARTLITLQQVQVAVESSEIDRLIYITSSNQDAAEQEPLAAAVAILGNRVTGDSAAKSAEPTLDTATIVHAGIIGPAKSREIHTILKSLARSLDVEFARFGVRFVQWATDEIADRDPHHCGELGFQNLGTLDYLRGEVDSAAKSPAHLRFEAVNMDDAGESNRFAALIEQTYTQTLDCPELSAYRTVKQTLAGYRASSSYAPRFWLNVYDQDDAPVGGVILGVHQNQDASEDPALDATPARIDVCKDEQALPRPASIPPAPTIEIVYMGIVPAARGSGLGKHLVQHAMAVGQQINANQMILAVDRRNKPARLIYESAGMQPVLSESVWVKLIDPAILSDS